MNARPCVPTPCWAAAWLLVWSAAAQAASGTPGLLPVAAQPAAGHYDARLCVSVNTTAQQCGPVTVDIGDLAPGDIKTVEWRGKPVWVVRRTPEMLAALQGHEAELVDPQSARQQQPAYAQNAARAIRPEVFVAIGICTHLGCSPSDAPKGANNPSLPTDWPGGFFCPCHGSTFDGAGRVFKNKPAPTNLEIPPHRYAGDTRILIGEDTA